MIGTGELACNKVYEDGAVIAFNDIAPQAPVHVLIVPKQHYRDLGDNVPGDVIARLFSLIPEVARLKGVDMTGYRAIVNNGLDAKQTVQHLHVHVLGGQAMSHGMVSFGDDAI